MSMKKLLRRGLAAAVLVTAMAGVISSAASASDSLRMSDARQAINRLVRHKARDGDEPGSTVLFCSRRSSRYFSCDLLFSDDTAMPGAAMHPRGCAADTCTRR